MLQPLQLKTKHPAASYPAVLVRGTGMSPATAVAIKR